jgi:hypothetical protein
MPPETPGVPVKITEQIYKGKTNSGIIDPAFDLKAQSYFADFRMKGEYYRMFAPTQPQVIEYITAYRGTNSNTKNTTASLRKSLLRKKLNAEASIPRLTNDLHILKKELGRINKSNARYASYVDEIAKENANIQTRKNRLANIISRLGSLPSPK